MRTFLVLPAVAAAAMAKPVAKVVALLKDMQKNLIEDAKKDEEIFTKLQCWCTGGNEEKTAAIEEAQAKIDSLQAQIEKEAALIAKLDQEIQQHDAAVAADTKELQEATDQRKKDNAAFMEAEATTIGQLEQLDNAIAQLKKFQAAAFLQTVKDMGALNVNLRPHVQAITNLVQGGPAQEYANQSGEVFGILATMKEQITQDKKEELDAESQAQKIFAELKASKLKQIALNKKQSETKAVLKADNEESKAANEKEQKNTVEQLDADSKYLMNLKKHCAAGEGEFEERVKTRNDEIKAVDQAVEILDSDDARDVFTRSLDKSVSFIQTSDSRAKASTVLYKAARDLSAPKLAAIAMSAKLDAFTEVISKLDALIKENEAEIEVDAKQKDACVKMINEGEKTEQKLTHNIFNLKEQASQQEDLIKNKAAEIADLKQKMFDLSVATKKSAEDRAEANIEYQKVFNDNTITIDLVSKAKAKLDAFYTTNSLLQQSSKLSQPAGPPPPEGFAKYENQGSSGGVLKLLETVISDAEQQIKESVAAEKEAVEAYTTFTAESAESFKLMTKQTNEAKAVKAETEEKLVATNSEIDTNEEELEVTQATLKSNQENCAFLLKNFDLRLQHKNDEIAAIKEAKAILKGAGGNFLQRK